MNDLRHLLGHRVLVQLDDATTLAGSLTQIGKRTLTLEGTSALAGDREQPVDGEVLVMLDRITWIQAP